MPTTTLLDTLKESLQAQNQEIIAMADKLDQLNLSTGEIPTGPFYAKDIIYNPSQSGSAHRNVQDAMDESYTSIGDISELIDVLLGNRNIEFTFGVMGTPSALREFIPSQTINHYIIDTSSTIDPI